MGLKLNSTGGTGSVQLNAPDNHNTDTTITLPADNVTGGQFVLADGNGDVNIDSGTLYVDAGNDRVGIGNASPEEKLEINGAVTWSGGLVSSKTSAGALDLSGDDIRIRAYGATAGSGELVFRTGGGGDSADAEAMRIGADGDVGIGIANPSRSPLHLHQDTAVNTYLKLSNSGTGSGASDGTDLIVLTTGEFAINNRESAPITFVNGGSERARIDSSGRLLVGTNSFVGTGGGAKLQVISNDSSDIRAVSIGDAGIDQKIHLGSLSSGTSYFTWGGYYDNGWNSDDSGNTLCIGAINFAATTSGSSIAVRVINSPNSSPKDTVNINPNMQVTLTQDASGTTSLFNNATSGSYTGNVQTIRTTRASNSAFNFILMEAASGNDDKFRVRGDGDVFADGPYDSGGADYAEYFEWSDGNASEEDRRGISVVLDGDKIREAVAGEEPIGVISANPSVVGDSAWNAWSGKYLRDDFGTYILETHNVVSWKETISAEDGQEQVKEHSYEDWNIPADVVVPDDAVISATDENGNAFTHRKLNPDYNPDIEYVSREDRPEWDTVGLMGKLRIRKGQVTGSRWIKMRDISDTVEEWLVR